MTIHAGTLASTASTDPTFEYPNAISAWGKEAADISKVKVINIEPGVVTGKRTHVLFWRLAELTQINGLENLDVSNTEDFTDMFQQDKKLTTIDISHWNTAKAKEVHGMFSWNDALVSVNASNLNTANADDIAFMFGKDPSLKEINISGWDTSQAIELYGNFATDEKLEKVDISGWDTSKATYLDELFYNTKSMWQLKLGPKVSFGQSKGDILLPEVPLVGTPIPGEPGHQTNDNKWQAVGAGDPFNPAGAKFTSKELKALYNKAGGPLETYVWAQKETPMVPEVPEVPQPDHHHTITTIEVKYQVHYKGAGKLTPEANVQTVTWQADRDDVTGVTFYSTPTDQLLAVKTPTIKGYQADTEVVPGKELISGIVAPVGTDVTVTYHKVSEPGTGGEMKPEKPTPPAEKPGQAQKSGQSTAISAPGMDGSQYQPSQTTQSGVAKQAVLPQTNEEQSMIDTIVGAVLTILGLFGIVILRQKKH